MRAEDQFHTGIVVDDLDAMVAGLSELFGYEWCDEIAVPTPVDLPQGQITLTLRFRYSRSVPRLEVIESVPGTLWTAVDGSGIHHLGYWSDDVPSDCDRLTARGLALEATGRRPDGTAYWAYLRGQGGPRVELVSRDLETMLQQLWGQPSS